MRIAVIGGGIMGLCAAKSLLDRGQEVTVFEQHRPGNPFGSSHGRSRIVRQAYPDQFYTELLLTGHGLWHRLEAESGTKLVHEVGLLFVSSEDGDELWHELDALRNLDVPHRVITSADIRAVHSHMVLEPGEVAVMTLSAGWADVQAVLRILATSVTDRGGRIVPERVTNLQESAAGFDRVVIAAGSWVTKFLDLRLTVTRQTYSYLSGNMEGPVWIEGFGDHMYGFPSEPMSNTFKVGCHTAGPETDPDSPDREPHIPAVAAIREAVQRRFGIREPDVATTETCLYTVGPDDDFQIGWVDDKHLVASPCSGHGFKFGPWVGELLAEAICDGREIPPRFEPKWA